MASSDQVKRKRVNLNVAQKLELIEKLEKGLSVAHVCEIYGVKKQTVCDIRKSKDKLLQFSLKYSVDSSTCGSTVGSRKHMKVARDKNLEEAVYKWYVQQRLSGVNVRSLELKSARETLGKHMGLNIKASDGWLWRFRKRHGIENSKKRKTYESLSTDSDTSEVETFRVFINNLILSEGLMASQLYNADETGLFYRDVPENTFAYKHEHSATGCGCKLSKERISVLLCANADGLHRLNPMVVGESKEPYPFKEIMNQLPIIYTNSKNAWISSEIFCDWFFKHFVPDVKRFQTDVLKIPPDDVKALLLLDNAPVHPNAEKLISKDGRIKCLFLPPNTSSVIQPMEQGIVVACKRLYKKNFLKEVMVGFENREEEEKDTRRARTLQNLTEYDIESALFNFSAAWEELKTVTFANVWNKLLYDVDPDLDFEGFETNDFWHIFVNVGNWETSEEDVQQWLENDESDPGYQVLTDEEIVQEVLHGKAAEVNIEKKQVTPAQPTLSEIKNLMDTVIHYIGTSSDPEIIPYNEHFQQFREIIIKKQHQNGKRPFRSNQTTPVPSFLHHTEESEAKNSYSSQTSDIE